MNNYLQAIMKDRARKKIKGKKGISLIMVVIGMVIFSTFAMSATSLMLQLQQNTVLTSDRLEEMTIAYDAWNKIVGEDFEELTARIGLLSGRTETTTVGTKYQLTSTYGTEGVFLNGQCSTGTATDEQQRCIPVTISISNTTAPSEKPYALSTTRIASKGGSGGSFGLPDYKNGVSIPFPCTYTPTEPGWIVTRFAAGDQGQTVITVNGATIYNSIMQGAYYSQYFIFPVSKNEVVKISHNNVNVNSATAMFYPCKQ